MAESAGHPNVIYARAPTTLTPTAVLVDATSQAMYNAMWVWNADSLIWEKSTKAREIYGYNGTNWHEVRLDASTRSIQTVSYPHHERHAGKYFYVIYSVASLGAMTSPDDAITLNWTTPDTTEWEHFLFWGEGTAGWQLKLVEAPGGGAASATGTLSILNVNRNSANTSNAWDIEGTPAQGQVSYDATLATGGTDLWSQYLSGSTGPHAGSASAGSDRGEIIMKQNTQYQLSLEGTDTDPATLYMEWYEHTDKAA